MNFKGCHLQEQAKFDETGKGGNMNDVWKGHKTECCRVVPAAFYTSFFKSPISWTFRVSYCRLAL